MTKVKTNKPGSPNTSSNVLTLKVDSADLNETQAESKAKRVVTVAEIHAVAGVQAWSKHSFGADTNLMTLLEKIEAQTAAVQSGDMSDVEAMLFGQALTLQATFTTLSTRAAQNLSTNAVATEACLRLAFKAQSQCRATLETLAEVKNPRTATFINQANVSGGNQQINNNGATPASIECHPHEKMGERPNELLSDERTKDVKPMDGRATGKAGKSSPRVEAMETRHRASHGDG